jgi:large subunit ribosomal protein L24
MAGRALGKSKLKKGDTVMVIAGRERGKTGKVLRLDLASGRVVVEKLNIIKRHTKPNAQVKQGGIIEKEAPIAISNVMFFCPVTQKPTRLGMKILEGGRRARVSKRAKEVLD